MKRISGLFISLLLALPMMAQAGGDPVVGKDKAITCGGCHGPDGNSFSDQWPKLAGQHESYIVKQLADFKSGARKDPTMQGMVANLSRQDMMDIGAYYARQSVRIEVADDKQAYKGEKIYRAGTKRGVAACMSCHGPSGSGNPFARYPALAGQHAAYTEKQLNAFRNHDRGNDYANMMSNTSSRLTAPEVKALAQYISGLHR